MKQLLLKAYEIARDELGVKELDGEMNNNKRIIEYHLATTLKATTDEVPWCASFVSWCLEQAGLKSTKSAWARSYLTWGIATKEPKEGDIVVFSRGKSSGHVAFFVSKNPLWVTVLGGNQDNTVNIKKYAAWRVLSFRTIL